MSFTDVLEGELLDHFFSLDAGFTQPAALWIGLFGTAATDAGGGVECSGGSYARQSAGIGAANWTRAGTSPTTVDNDNNIDFPVATADYSAGGGDPVQVTIHSLVSAGVLYMHSTTFAAVDINNGDTPRISAGNLDITLD